jgi:hypothetical protein
LRLNCEQYTTKIRLDSLTNILRKITKRKHLAVLYADTEYELKVREINKNNRSIQNFTVDSTEHRARVYYKISSTVFKSKSDNYAIFKIQNVELVKIITMQCILSGGHGGVGCCDIGVDDDSTRLSIRLSIKGESGSYGGVTIHTHIGSDIVPVLKKPDVSFSIKYMLTYLKRSQNLFYTPTDYTTLYVSERGIMFQTPTKELQTVVLFTSAIGSDFDLLSYA